MQILDLSPRQTASEFETFSRRHMLKSSPADNATDSPIDAMNDIKLTQYSHGGGCGCKIAPSILSRLLAELPPTSSFPDLLVGLDTSDDAAVYRLNDEQAIIATTDFFMPIVDDPFDFGRIAATNALSDVYAMGGNPIFALAVVGMPVDKLPPETIRQIFAGGATVCAAAGIPIAGGHSIDSPEPIYGLVALGLVHPDNIKRNDLAQAGDLLILGKPLGVGVMSAALKKGDLTASDYRQLLAVTTHLNDVGRTLGSFKGVRAMTDVTGFGLLGHLLEICRGSGLSAEVWLNRVPFMAEALTLAQKGYATGASTRNWESYGEWVYGTNDLPSWRRTLLSDPQTSGGLLVACSAESKEAVLNAFRLGGFESASVIGELKVGKPSIQLTGV
jgi:selenide, water dikinase